MECTGTRFRRHGFEFPCGQCVVCRLRIQRMWIGRILLEQALHPVSSFVTLTYDDDHYPEGFDRRGVSYPAGSVNPYHIQLWLKRLRQAVDSPIRYVAVGEYGDDNMRPHYHIALFGCADPAVIQSTWGAGFVVVKGIGPESAAYIVSYVLKRRNTVERSEGLHPEFKLQSLRPAIGLRTAQRLAIPAGRQVQGMRLSGRIYPLGRYLRGQLRNQCGPEPESSVALRHRIAKYSLQVRDVEDHKRKVENAKRFSEGIRKKRREKQGL